jgi:hypothetical protein
MKTRFEVCAVSKGEKILKFWSAPCKYRSETYKFWSVHCKHKCGTFKFWGIHFSTGVLFQGFGLCVLNRKCVNILKFNIRTITCKVCER